jgi:hypothetical protein
VGPGDNSSNHGLTRQLKGYNSLTLTNVSLLSVLKLCQLLLTELHQYWPILVTAAFIITAKLQLVQPEVPAQTCSEHTLKNTCLQDLNDRRRTKKAGFKIHWVRYNRQYNLKPRWAAPPVSCHQ